MNLLECWERNVVVTRTTGIISHEQVNKAVSPLPGMIGTSVSMQRVYHMTQLVARRDTTVLFWAKVGPEKIWWRRRFTISVPADRIHLW